MSTSSLYSSWLRLPSTSRRRGKPFLWMLLLVFLPASASANGALGMALATFDWLPWLAYAAVTVAFEAWLLGRGLAIPYAHALRLSLLANFLTAMAGGFLTGILVYPCLGMLGSVINPN